MTTTKSRGVARVSPAAAMMQLGSGYSDPQEVLKEFPENSLDAIKKHTESGSSYRPAGGWIVATVVMPDEIQVIDNGPGMIAHMSTDERDLLLLFHSLVSSGEVSEEDAEAFGQLIDPDVTPSLEWLVEGVGISRKAGQVGLRGTKGIGALSFRQIANRATWESRRIGTDAPGTATVIPPTRAQVVRNHIGYDLLLDSEAHLFDAFGAEMESGTIVRIMEFDNGIPSKLYPDALAAYYKARFGSLVQAGQVRLLVIDRITDEGRKTPGGRVIEVGSSEYRGIPIFSRVSVVAGAEFRCSLYYDPDAKVTSATRGGRVTLRRVGSDVGALAKNVTHFAMSPFNSHKVSGFVEFPDVDEQHAPWNLSKDKPLESGVYAKWAKIVEGWAREAQGEVEEIESRAKNDQAQGIAATVGKAIFAAMREIPVLAPLVPNTGTGKKKPKGTRPISEVRKVQKTIVVVQDEHGIGVSGVYVTVKTIGGALVKTVLTRKSGSCVIGHLEYGQYRAVLEALPPGMRLIGPLEDKFRLSESNPRRRIVFTVHTGRAKPVRKGMPSDYHVFPHPLADPEAPYSIEHLDNPDRRWLEINTEYQPMRDAMDAGDTAKILTLYADYVAMAVAEHSLGWDDPGLTSRAQCALMASLYDHVRGVKPTTRKK